MDKEEIFVILKNSMVDLFEVEADKIHLNTLIFEELDVDSIDFIDLAVKIRDITGQRVNPDDFKKVRTMQDLVDTAFELYNK